MRKVQFLIILCVLVLFLNGCGGISGHCEKSYTDCCEGCKKNAAIQASFGKEYNYEKCVDECENNYDECQKGIF